MAGITATQRRDRPRRDRLIRAGQNDTYRADRKPPEPTACPECGAVFHGGRWCWGREVAGAHQSLCPACQRIRDDYPGGTVTLSGDFLRDHDEELMGLVRNVEAREKADRPLKRIMRASREGGSIVISTTDGHLARAIGDSLQAAYQGDLDYQYADEGPLLRVRWTR